MDKIIRPKHVGRYPDRNIDCDEAMDIAIATLVDKANNAGWSTLEALDAIARVIPHRRQAYNMDPDPSDDPVFD